MACRDAGVTSGPASSLGNHHPGCLLGAGMLVRRTETFQPTLVALEGQVCESWDCMGPWRWLNSSSPWRPRAPCSPLVCVASLVGWFVCFPMFLYFERERWGRRAQAGEGERESQAAQSPVRGLNSPTVRPRPEPRSRVSLNGLHPPGTPPNWLQSFSLLGTPAGLRVASPPATSAFQEE